ADPERQGLVDERASVGEHDLPALEAVEGGDRTVEYLSGDDEGGRVDDRQRGRTVEDIIEGEAERVLLPVRLDEKAAAAVRSGIRIGLEIVEDLLDSAGDDLRCLPAVERVLDLLDRLVELGVDRRSNGARQANVEPVGERQAGRVPVDRVRIVGRRDAGTS